MLWFLCNRREDMLFQRSCEKQRAIQIQQLFNNWWDKLSIVFLWSLFLLRLWERESYWERFTVQHLHDVCVCSVMQQCCPVIPISTILETKAEGGSDKKRQQLSTQQLYSYTHQHQLTTESNQLGSDFINNHHPPTISQTFSFISLSWQDWTGKALPIPLYVFLSVTKVILTVL